MYDVPTRALRHAAQVMHEVADQVADEKATEAVHEHERRHHARPWRTPDRRPVEAMPFEDERLTDQQCAQLVELMTREGHDVASAAAIIGEPVPLVLLSLAAYNPRYLRELRVIANAF